jgi:hypothetical protein
MSVRVTSHGASSSGLVTMVLFVTLATVVPAFAPPATGSCTGPSATSSNCCPMHVMV